jgi:hypothetical protein
MTQEVEEIQKPDDRLKIKLHNEDKELFMSAGLIRRIVPYFMAGSQSFGEVLVDADAQSQILAEILVDRNERGEPDETSITKNLDGLGIEDSNKVIEWSLLHAAHFFIENVKMVKNIKTKEESMMETMSTLMQSLNGSSALTDQKQ